MNFDKNLIHSPITPCHNDSDAEKIRKIRQEMTKCRRYKQWGEWQHRSIHLSVILCASLLFLGLGLNTHSSQVQVFENLRFFQQGELLKTSSLTNYTEGPIAADKGG